MKPASDGAKSAARLRTGSRSDGSFRPDLSSQSAWTPSTWQSKPIEQEIVYEDAREMEVALAKLENLPPLVHHTEIEQLKQKLRDAVEGKAFILQGGDCAELFDYCNQDRIEAKLKVLLQMSLVLIWGTKLPLVRMGRIAGQYAKPRSKLTEVVEGYGEINSFRGDNVNGFHPSERRPDPQRLVSAYFHSAATLNFIRSSLASGFADLHQPSHWDLSHVREDDTRKRYQEVVDRISEGLEFMSTVGEESTTMKSVDFYVAHEALLLEYEQSLTRSVKEAASGKDNWYNLSAHFVWIGDRTRQIDGAHVEFFRGISNPIGVKVGPSTEREELVRLLDILDPDFETGRVTLITRYGADKIAELLPNHIKAVQKSKHRVVWISDPCHGNTKTSPVTKLKTRYFDDIMSEIRQALTIHKENDNALHGVHLELTGDAVTECIGGSGGLEDEDLASSYETFCDPRLSLSQSLDVAFLIADYYHTTMFKKN